MRTSEPSMAMGSPASKARHKDGRFHAGSQASIYVHDMMTYRLGVL